MTLFNMKKAPTDYTVIIGCGRLGATLASTLSENGNNVMVIDVNKDSFRKLSPSFGGQTVVGNAMNLETLENAQVNHNTTVVCVTSGENINIMVAQMAKVLFSAGKVITRLNDPETACVYKEQGIDTICPANLSAREINSLFDVTEQMEEEKLYEKTSVFNRRISKSAGINGIPN